MLECEYEAFVVRNVLVDKPHIQSIVEFTGEREKIDYK